MIMKFARVMTWIFSIVLCMLLLCCLRTYILHKLKRNPSEICTKDETVGYIIADAAWKHFKEALQFKTVSYAPGVYNRQELKKFQEYVIQSML